jgi:hypothetical protein
MIVYLATNSVNGMQYVGITSKKLSDRKYGHLKMSKDGKGSPVSIWEAIRQANPWTLGEACGRAIVIVFGKTFKSKGDNNE